MIKVTGPDGISPDAQEWIRTYERELNEVCKTEEFKHILYDALVMGQLDVERLEKLIITIAHNKVGI